MTSTANKARVPVARFSSDDDDALDTSLGFASKNPNHRVEVEWVETARLHADPDIQRGVEEGEVREIAKRFNPDALGTIVISHREDDILSLLDGLQRKTVVERVGYTGKLRALVHYGLSREEEAQLFLMLNYRRSVTALRQFKAQLTAKDPTALTIKRILDELGIPFGGLKGFNAVASAQKIVRQRPLVTDGPSGQDRLKWAMTMVHDIYDTEGRGGVYNGHVIEAFALVYGHLAKYGIDEKRMLDKLSSLAGGVNALIGQGRTIKVVNPTWHISYAIAKAIIDFYNRHKHRNAAFPSRLPDLPKGRLATKQLPVLTNDDESADFD